MIVSPKDAYKTKKILNTRGPLFFSLKQETARFSIQLINFCNLKS